MFLTDLRANEQMGKMFMHLQLLRRSRGMMRLQQIAMKHTIELEIDIIRSK